MKLTKLYLTGKNHARPTGPEKESGELSVYVVEPRNPKKGKSLRKFTSTRERS